MRASFARSLRCQGTSGPTAELPPPLGTSQNRPGRDKDIVHLDAFGRASGLPAPVKIISVHHFHQHLQHKVYSGLSFLAVLIHNSEVVLQVIHTFVLQAASSFFGLYVAQQVSPARVSFAFSRAWELLTVPVSVLTDDCNPATDSWI